MTTANTDDIIVQPQEIAKLVAEARASGAARLETKEGEFYLIAPITHDIDAPVPFDGAGTLLSMPQARAAYSDRTAWLMATLSECAYLKFEDAEDKTKKTKLISSLATAGFKHVEFFDNASTGTQAFLAIRTGEFAVLAFRGTEKDRKDIRIDMDARFYKTEHGKAHRGFLLAFQSVERNVTKALGNLLAEQPNLPIFLTGHSLGGALATAATHRLEEDFLLSACYTFGSPRVGTVEWSDSVKTPIYRIVNGADGIPLLPGSSVLRTVILWLPNLPFLTWTQGLIKKFTKTGFVGFQHAGDIRFIQGGLDQAKLKIGSAAAWSRFRYVVVGKIFGAIKSLNPKALSDIFRDHSITGYASKLRTIADNRN